jgi:excisionase family DNA binding protein
MEVAARLNVSRSTAYELLRTMWCLRVGKVLRVNEHELERWIAEHTGEPKLPERIDTRSALKAGRAKLRPRVRRDIADCKERLQALLPRGVEL